MKQNQRLRLSQLNIRPMYWALFFTLLGFGLRVQQLNFQPLWGDEGWSFYFATQSIPQLLALTAIDIHPPLYYLLLKGWLLVAGTGPEEARYLSVMVGTLLIPALAILGRRLSTWRVGVTAAAVVALMPMAVYYAQEARMYGLVTLLGLLLFYFFTKIETGFRRQKSAAVAYVVVTTAALYTHYYAFLIVLAQMLYIVFALVQAWRQKRINPVLTRRWLPWVYVGLLYLPWVIYAGLRLVSYVENKRNVEGYVPLSFGRFLADHFVAFSLGHLPVNLSQLEWSALLMVLLAAAGVILALKSTKRGGLLALYLFVPLLMGYLVNLFYPFTPSYFERALLLAAPAFWLLLAIGWVGLWNRQRWLASSVAAAMLAPVSISLFSFYTVNRYPDEDYRALLSEIAARATPDDTLLASYQWQLGFYQAYLPAPRPTLFAVPGWGEGWSSQTNNGPQLENDLKHIFNQSPRLWFPAYQAGGHIWEDEAETAIAALSYPALLEWISPQTKLTLAAAGQTPWRPAPPANFENRLALLEAAVGGTEYQAGRDIVPIKLIWQKTDNLDGEYRVSLRLVDSAGRAWASRDSQPRAGQILFADLDTGQTLTDHHGLLTPAGAPPGVYRLLLSVRRVSDAHPLDLFDEDDQPLGVELLLTEIMLTIPDPPVGAAALPIQTPVKANFGDQLRFLGYSVGQGPFKAGELLPVILFWESRVDVSTPLEVLVELKDADGQAVARHQQAPIWPTNNWQQGAIWRDPHDVALPAALAPGNYQLTLSLINPEQQRLAVNGNQTLNLTRVTTIDRPRNFDAPTPQFELSVNFGDQARLVGIDLPQTEVSAGDTIPLTLYWQAIGAFDKSWTVFVHLTNSAGQIISQQDQIPGGGQFPTTGWILDEYLIDRYNLVIPMDVEAGQENYRLTIGLYDANDFTRLPVVESGAEHITLDRWPISIK